MDPLPSEEQKIDPAIWLRRIRKSFDLTQQQFGEKISAAFPWIKPPIGLYISKLETGAIAMIPEKVRNIAKCLSISLIEPIEEKFSFRQRNGRGRKMKVVQNEICFPSSALSGPASIDQNFDLRSSLQMLAKSNFPITANMIFPILSGLLAQKHDSE